METKPQYTEPIEEPMLMSYRESYAWQLGYNEGWKQAKEMIANEFKHNQEWVDRILKLKGEKEYMKKRTLKRKEILKQLKNIFNYSIHITKIVVKILVIGLISGLAGAKSIELIYLLNKPLGYNYAYYMSYIEAGLIGGLLALILFRSKK
jgi:hypothetical protein